MMDQEIAEKLERIAKALEHMVDYGIHTYIVDDEDDDEEEETEPSQPAQPAPQAPVQPVQPAPQPTQPTQRQF